MSIGAAEQRAGRRLGLAAAAVRAVRIAKRLARTRHTLVWRLQFRTDRNYRHSARTIRATAPQTVAEIATAIMMPLTGPRSSRPAVSSDASVASPVFFPRSSARRCGSVNFTRPGRRRSLPVHPLGAVVSAFSSRRSSRSPGASTESRPSTGPNTAGSRRLIGRSGCFAQGPLAAPAADRYTSLARLRFCPRCSIVGTGAGRFSQAETPALSATDRMRASLTSSQNLTVRTRAAPRRLLSRQPTALRCTVQPAGALR
jgi:hypothetical protein